MPGVAGAGPGYSTGVNGIYGSASVVQQGYILISDFEFPPGATSETDLYPRHDGETGIIGYSVEGTDQINGVIRHEVVQIGSSCI